ncbi:MAG: DUF4118 domain-containing protein, partial [Acidimicrobiaceae bacterium]|nr:DUF4118 domain-containing protein [Acidimicrobiaceae bacterium]
AVGVFAAVALGAAMVPLRSHLSIATAGLVLVVPVVAGVVAGGLVAGTVSVVAGFLVYDGAFIPPYNTLSVGVAQNWAALGVYVVVMLLVAQVVDRLNAARADSQRRAVEAQRLFELSELLVEDRSLAQLLETIVRAVRTVFDVAGVAVLLPGASSDEGEHLAVAAMAGERLSKEEVRWLALASGLPVHVGTAASGPGELRAVALSAAGRPVGILALRGLPESAANRALLRTFANHAALALERAQLRAQALHAESLEEVDRVRRALLGAVSHDLRTPLATMKVASSTLLDADGALANNDARELYELLDVQTDRLTRLVTSLLDMTRYEAGVLEVRRTPIAPLDLVVDALASLRPSLGERAVDVALPDGLPRVDVDPVLVSQVLVNLIDNADRHAPSGSAIYIAAEARGPKVILSVTDRGPGVPADEHDAVFERFVRFDTGGRAGLGLAIAKTFVEAHGERIWVQDTAGGGASFTFTMPTAAADER